MKTDKPAHIQRFETLQRRGRCHYVLRSAAMVVAAVAAIQWLSTGAISIGSLLGYGFMGALIAQVDWWVLHKRYIRHHSSGL